MQRLAFAYATHWLQFLGNLQDLVAQTNGITLTAPYHTIKGVGNEEDWIVAREGDARFGKSLVEQRSVYGTKGDRTGESLEFGTREETVQVHTVC